MWDKQKAYSKIHTDLKTLNVNELKIPTKDYQKHSFK